MERDRVLEREFLEQAARDPEFAPRVIERIEHAAAEYGEDSFRQRTLRELCGEIAEEALDVAGWAVLARQLVPPAGVPPDRLSRVYALLAEASLLGAQIDLLMRAAASHLPRDPDASA